MLRAKFLSAASAFLISISNPSLAQSLSGNERVPPPQASITDQCVGDFADVHLILLLDASGSVKEREQELVMKGLYDAFTSTELTQLMEHHWQHFAVSTVHYADTYAYSGPYLFNSAVGARDVATEIFWDEAKNPSSARYPNVGHSTYLSQGFIGADALLAEDCVKAAFTAVLVLTDDVPQDYYYVDQRSRDFSAQWSATVHGTSFVTSDDNNSMKEVAEFLETITTPLGLDAVDQWGSPLHLRRGIAAALQEGLLPIDNFVQSGNDSFVDVPNDFNQRIGGLVSEIYSYNAG